MPPLSPIVRDILFLRRGPQDIPYSAAGLSYVATLCLIVQIAIALIVRDLTFGPALLGALVWLGVTLLVLNLLLAVRNLRSRFVQMAIAMLACNLVFTILFSALSLPIALFASEARSGPQALTPLQFLLGMFGLGLLIWKLIVDAHIFRHSLNLPFSGGMLVAALWIAAALVLAVFAGAE
jgi:hypothetical protein